ncbi:hypothetical protein [Croceicoccus bisphenolivorans]|uniref:hypothetical protein n=1 Tax=Croceicoccus bisphenolivorans TaxID=1783232 RepID=UPI000A797634|nr:hypothetical protein [Croceicoccus bisphenolivorans]
MDDGNPDSAGQSVTTGANAAETREERLARQLRENLKRRKAQARVIRATGGAERES